MAKEDKQPSSSGTTTTVPVGSLSINGTGSNVEVTVTSGTLTGKSARIILVPPSAGYFNQPDELEKKRA